MERVPLLTQRRIEAAFAKGIYDEMVAAFGEEAARRVLANAVLRMARASGAELARKAPGGAPDLNSFREILGLWTEEDALSMEVLTSTEEELHFNVTRCRYAEMYRAMGLAELGSILSCNRDGALCEGYDPKLKLTRTQTLMQGAPYCDFRYRRRP
jgi:hypothetical protein